MSSGVLGSFIAIKFIALYTKPFEKWPAFKMGLINSKGVKIRDAETQKEKDEFISWKNLIRKLKIILDKVPLGSFAKNLATFASAFWLLKEELDAEGKDGLQIINEFYEHFEIKSTVQSLDESAITSTFHYTDSGEVFNISKLKIIQESFFGSTIYSGHDIQGNSERFISASDIINETLATTDSSDIPVTPDGNAFGCAYFNCKSSTSSTHGRKKNQKWKTFISDDKELHSRISTFARKNPKSTILLRDVSTDTYTHANKNYYQ